jgi:homospermidine synthase
MEPDDLPYDELINYQLPFLGDFVFTKIDNYKIHINNNNLTKCIDATNEWTFDNFIVKN